MNERRRRREKIETFSSYRIPIDEMFAFVHSIQNKTTTKKQTENSERNYEKEKNSLLCMHT